VLQDDTFKLDESFKNSFINELSKVRKFWSVTLAASLVLNRGRVWTEQEIFDSAVVPTTFYTDNINMLIYF